MINDEAGKFTTQTYPIVQGNLSVPVVADLNKDGIPDIVVVGQYNSYTFLGQGRGVFAQAAQIPTGGTSAVVTDLNGDGLPDLAIDDGVNRTRPTNPRLTMSRD